MVKKDRKGRWYFRTRETNPFTQESFRQQKKCPEKNNTREFALAMERDWVRQVTADPSTQPKSIEARTVKEVAEAYLVHMNAKVKRKDKAESYVIALESVLNFHIVPDLGKLLITDVDEEVLVNWKEKLQDKPCRVNGKRARKLLDEGKTVEELPPLNNGKVQSARNVGRILVLAHGMFEFALSKKWLPGVPAFPKAPTVSKKHPTYLTYEEADATLAAANEDDVDDHLLLLFAIDTGARASEQSAFAWDQIEWQQGNEHIRIDRAKKQTREDPNVVGDPKSHADRTVPLSSRLLRALKAAKLRRFGVGSAKGLIFRNPESPSLMPTVDHFRPVLKRALKKAEVTKKVRWHDLRHTYGSHRAMEELSMQQIQAWMGHHSVTVTEIYAHLCPLQGRAALLRAENRRAQAVQDSQEAERTNKLRLIG